MSFILNKVSAAICAQVL